MENFDYIRKEIYDGAVAMNRIIAAQIKLNDAVERDEMSAIEKFCDNINLEELRTWCNYFGVDRREPLDDEMPDWEDDLRSSLVDAMEKI